MNRTKVALIAIILSCIGLLGFAVYMQTALDMLPCPMCILQRYAFCLIALTALVALLFPKQHRLAMRASIGFSVLGIGVAGYQLYEMAQPPHACGIEPFTAPMNRLFMAEWFPTLFKVNGLCETPYDPILGLSIPTWSLLWFVLLAVVSLALLISKKKERVFFGKIRA